MKTIKIILLILVFASPAFSLEALVAKHNGNIIVLKPNNSRWGKMEIDTPGSFYTIKNIEDDSLKFNKDEKHPKIIFPYAVYEEQERYPGYFRRVLITESEYKVDPKADDEKPLVKGGEHFNKSLVIDND